MPRIAGHSPIGFPAADHELSDKEIEATFGDYMRHAQVVFMMDSSYLVAMAEVGNKLAAQREVRSARDTARRAAKAAKASSPQPRYAPDRNVSGDSTH